MGLDYVVLLTALEEEFGVNQNELHRALSVEQPLEMSVGHMFDAMFDVLARDPTPGDWTRFVQVLRCQLRIGCDEAIRRTTSLRSLGAT